MEGVIDRLRLKDCADTREPGIHLENLHRGSGAEVKSQQFGSGGRQVTELKALRACTSVCGWGDKSFMEDCRRY